MIPILRALLWKTFRELGSLLATLLGVCVLAVVAVRTDAQALPAVLYLFALFLPAAIALQTLTADGPSQGLLDALPVRPALPWLLKMLTGVVAAALPGAIVVFCTPRHAPLPLPAPALAPLATAALYLWIVVLAARARSQGRVLLAALLVLVFNNFALSFLYTAWLSAPRGAWIVLLAPTLSLYGAASPSAAIALHLLTLLLLLPLALWQLTRHERRAAAPQTPARRRDVVLFQPRSPAASILWKTWRECRLLAGGALLLAISLSLTLGAIFTAFTSGAFRVDRLLADTRAAAPYVGIFIAAFLAIATATALTCNDSAPGLALFLASRPIRRRGYFWLRYTAGLALNLATLAAAALLWRAIPPDRLPAPDAVFSALALIALGQWLAYTLATFWGTLLRRRHLALLLSAISLYVLTAALIVLAQITTRESATALAVALAPALLWLASRASRRQPAL
jgi:hypothetical protein